jgi:hypothetical protein
MGEPEPDQRMARIVTSVGDVDAQAWNACANPPNRAYSPFLDHAFLKALEDSGSVAAETGWLPQHLVLLGAGEETLGCMPCYLKSHSQGEFVFDYGWADAFEHAGGSYYPKLQCSVPFTPATGRRLLVPEGPEQRQNERLLLNASLQLCQRLSASSLHVTFLTHDEWVHLGEIGMLQRTDQQFHWHNNGYENFDEFLNHLSSRKRKQVKKERKEALSNGVEIEWLTGSGILEEHWDAFFEFYTDTGDRKWGTPYLTRDFFSLVTAAMADRVLLVMCKRQGRYIAGALNFIGGDTLYGRNWGCIEDHRSLHFEACYYQAIEFAITHKLKTVEAGAQGAHKLARGYLPVTTYSCHYIAHAGLRAAVADYLDQERDMVQRDQEILSSHSPYKSTLRDADT